MSAVVVEMNGFDLLLGNDSLSQLGSFSIQYNWTGESSYSVTTAPIEDGLRGRRGLIVSRESCSIPAFSMRGVVAVTQSLEEGKFGHMVEPTPKVLADKGISIGRLLLPRRLPSGLSLVSFDEFLVNSSINPRGNSDRESFSKFHSNVVQHQIDTGLSLPIHPPPYVSAWRGHELIQSQTREMLRNQVITPSSSPWASPVVLVKKKNYAILRGLSPSKCYNHKRCLPPP